MFCPKNSKLQRDALWEEAGRETLIPGIHVDVTALETPSKERCRPHTPLHGSGLFKRDNSPGHTEETDQEWFEEHTARQSFRRTSTTACHWGSTLTGKHFAYLHLADALSKATYR